MLPKRLTSIHVAYGLDVKDAITIILIVALALIVLLLRLPARLRKYLNRRPFYERIDHNFFYLEDGTFILRSIYVLNAGWMNNLELLPSEGFMWFNHIPRDRLHYRLIHHGKRQDRTIHADHPTIQPIDFKSPRQGERETSFLSWTPKISPPLSRFESVAYQVEVTTPGTETAAFTSEGTILGFGTSAGATSATLHAFAPPGYAFHLLPPVFTEREMASGSEVRTLRNSRIKPTLSVDESIVMLTTGSLKAGRRYWVHFRFEKVGKVSER